MFIFASAVVPKSSILEKPPYLVAKLSVRDCKIWKDSFCFPTSCLILSPSSRCTKHQPPTSTSLWILGCFGKSRVVEESCELGSRAFLFLCSFSPHPVLERERVFSELREFGDSQHRLLEDAVESTWCFRIIETMGKCRFVTDYIGTDFTAAFSFRHCKPLTEKDALHIRSHIYPILTAYFAIFK